MSEDAGETWSIKTCDLMVRGVDSYVDPVGSIGTTWLFRHFLEGTYRSTAGGDWTNDEEFTSSFFVADEGWIYANDLSDFMRSRDGMLWEERGELPSFLIEDLVIEENLMVVATWSGVGISGDDGASWQLLGSEFPDTYARSIDLDHEGRAVVGSDCCVRRSALPINEYATSSKREEIADVNDQVRPYPNPASRVVEIPVIVSATTHLELSVFDELGRRVAQLYDGAVAPGVHRLQWNVQGIAAGQYTIRAGFGRRTSSRTIVVLH